MPQVAAAAIVTALGVGQATLAAVAIHAAVNVTFALAADEITPTMAPDGDWTPATIEAGHDGA